MCHDLFHVHGKAEKSLLTRELKDLTALKSVPFSQEP